MTARATAARSVLRDYLSLCKPRIVLLLVFTALCGMFLAAGGPPDLTAALVVAGGGALASGGANALNHFLDRDIDARMRRTRNRPVPALRVQPRGALLFGIATNAIAFVLFATLVNPLSAALTLCATLFYVFVYTMGLKRSTPQNIVIGGAAGALPPVIGWTAVTGSLGLPAAYMFAIIFFWTPPHFWALALLLKDDYARAGVPMLPVVMGVAETKRNIPALHRAAAAADVPLLRHAGGGMALPGRGGDAGPVVHLVRGASDETARGPGRARHVPLLADLPDAAVRGDSGRRGGRLELGVG